MLVRPAVWQVLSLVRKRGRIFVTAVVGRMQLKDTIQPIEAIWDLDSLSLIVSLQVDSVCFRGDLLEKLLPVDLSPRLSCTAVFSCYPSVSDRYP